MPGCERKAVFAEENVPDDDGAAFFPFASKPEAKACDPKALAEFLQRNPAEFHVFQVPPGSLPFNCDALPSEWLEPSWPPKILLKARPGEFAVFCVAVFASSKPLLRLQAKLAAEPGAPSFLESSFSCVNLGGTDIEGRRFEKRVDVPAGRFQLLCCGVKAPSNISPAVFAASLEIAAENVCARRFELQVELAGTPLAPDEDAGGLSRLEWLDSTAGQDSENVFAPFLPVARSGLRLEILGREVELAASGLPARIVSRFDSGNKRVDAPALELTSSPLEFIVDSGDGRVALPLSGLEFVRETSSFVEWRSRGVLAGALSCELTGRLEFDGFMDFKIRLKALKSFSAGDAFLSLRHSPAASGYFMGLGLLGGVRPPRVKWRWDVKKWQDGYWTGAVNGGLKLQLRDAEARSPHGNCYYSFYPLSLPKAWFNEGRGGIALENAFGSVDARAFSGPFTLAAGEERAFDFSLWITPFKPIRPAKHLSTRVLQIAGDEFDLNFDELKSLGISVLSLHHAIASNPIINSPFNDWSSGLLAEFSALAKRRGFKLDLYYTLRELSVLAREFAAFCSMNGEIVCPGQSDDARPLTNANGPHKWLKERLGRNCIPAWRARLNFKKGALAGALDLAVLTTPGGRLENFYLEGLKLLISKFGVDGLYIDDTALTRRGMQRAARLLRSRGENDPVVDFHAWHPYQQDRADGGLTSPAYRDLHNFPYFSRLWLGESFRELYELKGPDFWLVEFSGIPFGLMSELMGSGDQLRGLLFGATQRFRWAGGDPRGVWKVLDEFGVAGSSFTGFWDEECPASSDSPFVPVSAFKRPDGRLLLALASWHNKSLELSLRLDGAKLERAYREFSAPEIAGVQSFQRGSLERPLRVAPGGGAILLLDPL